MGFYPDMKQEEHLRVETRRESVRVYGDYMADQRQGIWTWGEKGEKGCAAFEITYDALARLVAAIACNPSVTDAMGKEWRDALSAATAQYTHPAPGAPA